MCLLRYAVITFSVFLFASPAPAWNFVTHRVIAALAYDQLKLESRARVDALIRQHPDYAAIFAKNAPNEEPARARAAFIEAAVWSDQIRNDPRFFDDTRKDAVPTPTLPGFPDMKRHTGWHNIDLPFSQDGAPLERAETPNIVTELQRIMAEFPRPRTGAALQSYDLVWLIHMFGDIHAPLHCVGRDSTAQPKGDLGGNLVFVTSPVTGEAITLHKYWDDAVGTDTAPEWVASTAREIASAYSPSRTRARQHFNPPAWAQESLNLAKKQIYTFGQENGSREHPIGLSPGYRANARKVAEAQVARAADRLAVYLNARLR